MELTEIVYNKSYWEIRFEDIPELWILGVRCGCCGHEGPTDRDKLRRNSGEAYIRFSTRITKCTKCGNRDLNRIYIAGKLRR